MNDMFQTTNRTLEQFLYSCGVKAFKITRTDDFMNCWHYTRTARLEKALSAYKEIIETPLQ